MYLSFPFNFVYFIFNVIRAQLVYCTNQLVFVLTLLNSYNFERALRSSQLLTNTLFTGSQEPGGHTYEETLPRPIHKDPRISLQTGHCRRKGRSDYEKCFEEG